jgi:uncharacterized protein
MTKRLVRMAHCYRCVYTWRMRRQYPRMCPRCKSKLWNVPKLLPVEHGTGLGVEDILVPHRHEILQLARKFGAKRLCVFGSVARNQATAKSDVDLLVTWGRAHSLLDRAAFQEALEGVLGRSVDLVNEGGIHWAMAPQVRAESVRL